VQNLRAIYREKGLAGALLEDVVQRLTEDHDRWLRATVSDELKLAGVREERPWLKGLLIGPARWFQSNRDNVQLKALVQGATAAATGAIIGAVEVLGSRTLVDMATVLIALASLAILLRFKVPASLAVTAGGIAGLVVSPFCMEACDGACIMHPSQYTGFAVCPTLRCSRPVSILTSSSQEAQWLRYTRACTRSQHIGTLFMVSPYVC